MLEKAEFLALFCGSIMLELELNSIRRSKEMFFKTFCF